jgi:septum formation protein
VVVPPDDELPLHRHRGRHADFVRRAALAKARSVARETRGLVLAADTIVICDGILMGKPADAADARRMIRRLSGRWHRVYTGLALVHGAREMTGYECTRVAFRRLTDPQINSYLASGEPFDKAGAYAIQGLGAALIRSVRGCYSNVIGLPIPKLLAMLADFRYDSCLGSALPTQRNRT